MSLETFLTIAEADTILGSNLPWSDATDPEKQTALEMARVYTEANYSINFVESVEIPEKVKIGNALIANEDLIKNIFSRQDLLGSLEEVSVKAGSVETRKRYTNKISKTWKDPFTKATAIMRPYCILSSGSSIKYLTLVRG